MASTPSQHLLALSRPAPPHGARGKSLSRKSLSRVSIGRAIRWHRRSLAAICAAICLFATISALQPTTGPTTAVLVAAHPLKAGQRLAEADVTTLAMPADAVPEHALTDSADVVGQVLLGAATQRTVLTSAALLSHGTGSTAPGEQLVPFRVRDAGIASLLKIGDRISIVTQGSDGAAVTLAQRVRVAALPANDQGSSTWDSTSNEPLVVVAADEATARTLATAATRETLGIVLG